jgi:hypothetical protein
MNNKILIGSGLVIIIVVIILANTFLNQANNPFGNGPNGLMSERDRQLSIQSQSSVSSQNEQIVQNLNTISKIEGQKITSINELTIILENGEKIEFSDAKDINCQVGDKISDYDSTKQALVCIRTNPVTGQQSNFFSSLATGFVGGMIGNYIASKLFARNNGVTFDQSRNGFVTPNGNFYGQNNGSYSTTAQSAQAGRSGVNTNRGIGGWFGGWGQNNNQTNNQNNSNKNTGTATGGGVDNGPNSGSKGSTHVGSGGISGSKGVSGVGGGG